MHRLNWRLSIELRDGTYSQIATMDFRHRETIELQLVQLLFKRGGDNSRKLFEFMSECGELLAVRADAYRSHSVTAIDT